MKKGFLILDSFLKFQSIVYLFIIIWAVLIANLQNQFTVWKYIEKINKILFFIYFLIGLVSVIILIIQILKIYFSSDNSMKRKVWIVANILLYYGVLSAVFYLSAQFRF
ncbi:membrane protein YdbS with pleckstrin-like domain [Flavobacterium nitrogenifigens]|uniref:Membrane protein YdbS with pleckstrin-like domain n=2 Tax=Flavobacterium TaxID=237 RepID=A0A7W7N7L6_9FLAO|nr:membrane protein YdbS with pleckstrin-like domain [Flavobacterium nitrogenifigens]MBB6387851.1 membrane protein YdbS with pleckstrin-like domain [Flavobacterium notoginsengisoli]